MCLEKLDMTKSELAVWVGAALTFLAILVALLKEELQRLWHRPVLDVSVKTEPPDCHISRWCLGLPIVASYQISLWQNFKLLQFLLDNLLKFGIL